MAPLIVHVSQMRMPLVIFCILFMSACGAQNHTRGAITLEQHYGHDLPKRHGVYFRAIRSGDSVHVQLVNHSGEFILINKSNIDSGSFAVEDPEAEIPPMGGWGQAHNRIQEYLRISSHAHPDGSICGHQIITLMSFVVTGWSKSAVCKFECNPNLIIKGKDVNAVIKGKFTMAEFE